MELSDFIKSIPVLRLILPFVPGIMLGFGNENYFRNFHWYFSLSILFIVIIIILNKFWKKYSLSWYKGFMMSGLLFLTGLYLPSFFPSDADLPETKPDTYWICKVSEYPSLRKNSIRIQLKVLCTHETMKEPASVFSVLTYFSLDSECEGLVPGDIILAKMIPARPHQNGNPKEFNYRRYLYKQGIYYQAFIKNGEWTLLNNGAKSIRYLPLHVRQRFVNRMKTIIISPERFAIISALSVGVRDFMDEEMKLSYSDAGAMHVLAVSGLHVGLVWYVLNILFGRLRYFRFTRGLYWILMTSLLWMYVMITGMSPSVTRAGIMLTLVITSGMAGRNSGSSNPVFLSAFILLMINPFLLFDVGFQFSYLAVFGILFFHPVINGMLHIKNPLKKYLWDLTTVSIAAQTATFIPALYYFNKFPVYFLLSNFLVIPLVTGILMIMIVSVFFWFMDPVFLFLVKSGAFLSGLMNAGVRFIESLPCSSVQPIYIDEVDVFLLFSALVITGMAIFKKRRNYLVYMFIFLAIFMVYGSIRDNLRKKRGVIVVHNIPGILAIDMAFNGVHYLITADLCEESKAKIIRNCNRFWLYERKGYPVFIDLTEQYYYNGDLSVIPVAETGISIILFNKYRLAVIEDFSSSGKYNSPGKISNDILIINTRGTLRIPTFLSLEGIKHIVIATGFRGRVIRNQHSDNLDCFEVDGMGAYVHYFWQQSSE